MIEDELEGLISFEEVDAVDGVLSTSLLLALLLLLLVESEGKAMVEEEWMGWYSITHMLEVVVMAVMMFALLS